MRKFFIYNLSWALFLTQTNRSHLQIARFANDLHSLKHDSE